MTINECPFCHYDPSGILKPEVFYTEDYYTHILCRNCGACGPAIFQQEEERPTEKAIQKWNAASSSPSDAPDGSTPHPEGQTASGAATEGKKGVS